MKVINSLPKPPLTREVVPLPHAARQANYGKTCPPKLYRATDLAVALITLMSVLMASNTNHMPNGIDEFLALRITLKNLLMVGLFSLLWPTIFAFWGLYNTQLVKSRRDEIFRIVKACSVGSLFVLTFALTSISGAFHYHTVVYFWFGVTTLTILVRYSASELYAYTEARRSKKRSVIIVGSGPRALRLYKEICASALVKYDLLGFVDSRNDHAGEEIKSRLIGSLEQFEDILMHHVVDDVFIALPVKSCYNEIQNTIRVCENAGVQAKYLSDTFNISLARPSYEQTHEFPLVTMKMVHDDSRLIIKRAADIVGALWGLIIFSPLMILTAIAIKLTCDGPVLFHQQRFGLNKRKFKIYKFRTMEMEAETRQHLLESKNEAVGPVFKIKDDPRVTRVGKILRRTSIDELPQLFNVLFGTMSLVGPRPLPQRDVSRFTEAALMRRFSVKPGITCLWQISGRSNINFDRWIDLDLKYIDEWSLTLDLEILLKTVPAVLKCDGAV